MKVSKMRRVKYFSTVNIFVGFYVNNSYLLIIILNENYLKVNPCLLAIVQHNVIKGSHIA